MARITIGLGFVRTLDQEKEWRRAAAAMPEEWEIVMVGRGIFEVSLKGPGLDAGKTFGHDGSADVLGYLESITPATP